MQRANELIQQSGTLAMARTTRPTAERGTGQASEVPMYLRETIKTIRTRFATSADDWDVQDSLCYAEVLYPLPQSQLPTLVRQLRAAHHWRPSVAQVGEMVRTLMGASHPAASNSPLMIGADDKARQVIRVHRNRQLPSTGESETRRRARANLPWNREKQDQSREKQVQSAEAA